LVDRECITNEKMLAQEGDIFVKIVTTNQITAMTN
jgi:hypothetical protein